MTNKTLALPQNSIADSADLPRPDAVFPVSDETSFGQALPRPLPDVNDSGRIMFGASCRIPMQK
jgi:hypothetical protein